MKIKMIKQKNHKFDVKAPEEKGKTKEQERNIYHI